jgi:type II secretory pathway pseudopilin PulG
MRTQIGPRRPPFAVSPYRITSGIAIIAILASMLLPALGRAKQKSQSIACINNLKQLATAATVYAVDFRDYWPLNNEGDPAVNLANPPAGYVAKVWAEGREGSNLLDEQTAQGMLSDRVSLLAPYEGQGRISMSRDKKLWKVNNVVVMRPQLRYERMLRNRPAYTGMPDAKR